METITFAKLVENAVAGTELVRTDFNGSEVRGYWTGETLSNFSGATMTYVYNCGTQKITAIDMESNTDWRIRLDDNGNPVRLTDTGLILLAAAGEERKNYASATRRAENAVNEFDSFKRRAQSELTDWAVNNLTDEEDIQQFSEMMESIGLEGIRRQYTVQVTVTYNVEVEVEATSEEAAREELDNNLSDYIYDAIDVSYYEDYSIEDVSLS